ncbi:MAG: superoxide dismutase [Steroidobacteraceae bacterium]
MTESNHFELPALGYAYDALAPAYSAELLELHYAVHHRACVDGANRALETLAAMRAIGDFNRINQVERDLAFHLSGHVLHSIFWRNLEPNDGASPNERLEAAICSSFGSVESLRHQFSAAAIALQGAGWVALCWELARGSLLVQQVHDHQDNCGTATLPLLVLDMWEHAYYLQYSNRRELWFLNFWDMINWADVGRRFDNAECADLALDLASAQRVSDVVTPFRRDRL